MRNVLIVTSWLLAGSCATEPTEGPFARPWLLVSVDGKSLPTQADMPDGYVLEALYLSVPPLERPKGDPAQNGTISLLRSFLDADHVRQQTVQAYPYGVHAEAGSLTRYAVTISLCPVGAPCAAIIHELVGTMDLAGDMVLTEYIRPNALRTLRFVRQPTMPD